MGRVPFPIGQRKYKLSHMWERHHEILRHLVMGTSRNDIARILKISPQTVTDTANSPIVQKKLLELRVGRDVQAMNVSSRIKELAPAAVAKVKEVMDKGDLKTSLTAAKDILDRAGHVAPHRIDLKGLVAHVTTKDLEEIKERQRKKGILVEGEVVEEKDAE